MNEKKKRSKIWSTDLVYEKIFWLSSRTPGYSLKLCPGQINKIITTQYMITIKVHFYKIIYILDKTLKGVRGLRLDNRKVFSTSGHRINCFEFSLCSSLNYTIWKINYISFVFFWDTFSNCKSFSVLTFINKNHF